MKNHRLEKLEKEIEKKIRKKEKRKKPKMRVTGKSVFALKRVIEK